MSTQCAEASPRAEFVRWPIDGFGRILCCLETAEGIVLWCASCGTPWQIPLGSYWREPLRCPGCGVPSQVIRDLQDFENVR